MHVFDYIKFQVSRNARWFTMFCIVVYFALPVAGEELVDPVARVAELGGSTAVLVLALYWLREAQARRLDDVREQKQLRLEDAQRYAEQLRQSNDKLAGILNKLIKWEEE